MRALKIFVLFAVMIFSVGLAGCDKEISAATITRDDAQTGGTLSFVYDSKTRTVQLGGEGEVVQFSEANEALGLDAGCRVGLKITAPDEEVDVSSATLQMNGVSYSSGDFLESVNGQKQRTFTIQPLVSEKDKEVKFQIKWADDVKSQTYQILIADGTKFMASDGSIDG